jgi:hypothetical protein
MGDTFTSLKDQLNFRLGNRADPTEPGVLRIPDMLPIWVNACYIDLATRLRLPELEESATLVIDPTDSQHPRYLLPIDYFSLFTIKDNTNDKVIDKVPVRIIREKTLTAADRPKRYALWRKEIIFDPSLTTGSTVTVQIDYRKKPTKMDDTTNLSSVLDDEWDEVIVQGSEYRALNDMGGNLKQEAAAAKALFNVMIKERIDRISEEQTAELANTALPDKVSRQEGTSVG